MASAPGFSRYYPWIAIGSVVLLVGFLLFGPLERADRGSSVLWEENWQAIELLNKGHTTLRLIREGGLFADQYFVEYDDARAQRVRRRGGATVQNSIYDWRKPTLVAYYALDKERAGSAGLNGADLQLRFYSRAGAEPVTLTVGNKSGANNRFISSTYSDHDRQLLVIPDYIIEKLKADRVSFRERRLLYYGSNSYTTRLRLRADLDGREQTLELTQRREMKKPEGADASAAPTPVFVWTRTVDGKEVEIPLSLGGALEGAVKGLQIDAFYDEPTAPLASPAGAPPVEMTAAAMDALWKRNAPNLLTLEVSIKDAGDERIELRRTVRNPADPLPDGAADRYLLKTDRDPQTDWARATAVDSILSQMRAVLSYKEAQPSTATPPGRSDVPGGGSP